MKVLRSLLGLTLFAFVVQAGMCGPTEPQIDARAFNIVAGPETTFVQSGATAQLTATVTNKTGEEIPGLPVAFKSSDTTRVVIGEGGVMTGAKSGKVTVIASYGALRDTVVVNVTAGAAASVAKAVDVPFNPVVGASASIAVRVLDAAGNNVPDAAVEFVVTGGGGSVTPASVTTNASGVATTALKIGNTSGANTVTATAAGIATGVSFTTTSIAATAASVVSVTADPSGIVAGEKYGEIRAKVTDAFGNPKSNTLVTFAAATGGGSVLPTTANTNASGEAFTQFTTGKTAGSNTATASISGVTAKATFATSTVAGPAAKVSVSVPILGIAAGSSAAITASVADVNNNPTSGTLTYTSRATNIATVATDGTITAVAPGQTFIVAAGPLGVDSMIAVVRATDAPVLFPEVSAFNIPVNTDVVFNIVMDMTGTTEKLGATTVKIEWDPTVVTYRLNAKLTGGPTPVVNTTQTTSGALSFTIADATGLTGKVALLKITLRTVAAVGKSGVIRMSASESMAAGTFTDLLPKTMLVTVPIITR